MKIIITFVILSIINVIFSTVRSIATINGGKTVASLLSGGYFAFYNIMLIYTVAEFPMLTKCIITFICNVVGVWLVKFVQEKQAEKTKDFKLWKVEATVPTELKENVIKCLNDDDVSFNYIEVGRSYVIMNIYCPTPQKSKLVKQVLTQFKGVKYFVSESQTL